VGGLRRPHGSDRGYSLVEAVLALTIFGLAVIVAAGFLEVHMNSARRLQARADLVRSAETLLESARGGALPMLTGELELEPMETRSSVEIDTRLEVTPLSVPGLYELRAEARATVRSEEMVVVIATQVWRP
jgi:type II secretory pathway pseudopilin PulG